MYLDFAQAPILRGFDSTQYKLSVNVANDSVFHLLVQFQVDSDKALLLRKIGVYSSDGIIWGNIAFRLQINGSPHPVYGTVVDQIGDIFQPQEINPVYIDKGSLVELLMQNKSAVANPLLGMRIMGSFIKPLY